MTLKAVIHDAEEGGFWAKVSALSGRVTHCGMLFSIRSAGLTVCACVLFLLATGCQTQRQLASVRRGMSEAEVRAVFGPPDSVVAGGDDEEGLGTVWFYNAYVTQPYLKWIYIPRGGREYGGDLQQVQTSRGVRYQKFRVVFLSGVVDSVTQFPPPKL